jgi:hypothetical protein
MLICHDCTSYSKQAICFLCALDDKKTPVLSVDCQNRSVYCWSVDLYNQYQGLSFIFSSVNRRECFANYSISVRKEHYFGFFAPSRHKQLALLRKQLDLIYPSCANEIEATQAPVILEPKSKLCARTAISRCCSSVLSSQLDAAHHEPLWFLTPSFLLGGGFSPGTQASARLSPRAIFANHLFFAFLVCSGWLLGYIMGI